MLYYKNCSKCGLMLTTSDTVRNLTDTDVELLCPRCGTKNVHTKETETGTEETEPCEQPSTDQ
jgi:phage FluMu protein Com